MKKMNSYKDKKRKICIVSASRAEWYLLEKLAEQIANDKALKLQLIITAAHLSKDFGQSYKEIEHKFHIDKKIPILLANDDKISICKAMGLGFISLSEALAELEPDIIVVLGDRYEMLVVASVALMMNITLAHLCGGELSLGATDDSIRHSISKMAHLHFVRTQAYKKRLLQLGEQSHRIFNIGSLISEYLKDIKLLSKKELEKELNFKLDEFYLITYHPETLFLSHSEKNTQILLKELDKQKAKLIFTKANADANGKIINALLQAYCEKNPHKACLFDNLGAKKYLSAMKYAKAVVGNSSSGITEAVYFKTPCINIGERQKGRLRTANIIDTSINKLPQAFKKLENADFQHNLKKLKNPYKNMKASFKIKEVLKKVDLSTLLHKEFVDLG